MGAQSTGAGRPHASEAGSKPAVGGIGAVRALGPLATSVCARVGTMLRAIIGAPDYDRYLDHVRRAHPGQAPLSREQFAARQLDRRYNRVGGRCC